LTKTSKDTQRIQEGLQTEGFKDITPNIFLAIMWYDCWVVRTVPISYLNDLDFLKCFKSNINLSLGVFEDIDMSVLIMHYNLNTLNFS